MSGARVLAGRLRLGELSFDEVLAQFDPDATGSYELGELLAEHAEEGRVGDLLDHVADSRAQWIVGMTLLSRGYTDAVLQRDWADRDLIGLGAEAAWRGIDDERLFERVSDAVAHAIVGDDVSELSVLSVKSYLHELRPAVQSDVLEWLDPRVREGFESEFYFELDYAYGQVDPGIELALCYLQVGDTDRAIEWLEQRHDKWPKMMHWEELLDLATVCARLPDQARATWWSRFREWASATDELTGMSEGPWLELEWLARAPGGGDRDDELLAMIAEANVEALGMLLDALTDDALVRRSEIVRADETAIRRVAVTRLLELLTSHVGALGTGDAADRARHVRASRSAATALDHCVDELGPEQRITVGEAARKWAAWFVDQDPHGDWLPHVYTAIAFAGSWLAEIEPAARRIRARLQAGDQNILTYQGIERLVGVTAR